MFLDISQNLQENMYESQTKSKTVMNCSSRKKKEHFWYRLFCSNEIFQHLCFVSMYRVLNTPSEYTYFYISKKIFVHFYTFVFVLKIVESFQCILNRAVLWALNTLVIAKELKGTLMQIWKFLYIFKFI